MNDTPDEYKDFKRNLLLLFICWALVSTAMMQVVNVTALVGHLLAENKALAALPVALQWIATAILTIPASFLMQRVGRRNGFWVAAGLLIAASLLSILALEFRSFWLYVFACTLLGGATGFSWYYRFAAAEVVPVDYRSRAISLVLAGGIFAALVGPTIARNSKDLIEGREFVGSFLAIIVLQIAVAIVLSFVRTPRPARTKLAAGRPLTVIAAQPKFIVAVLGGVLGYGVMVLLMSITPLAMGMNGHSFNNATEVIRWHALGMYLPAFFTGHLIRYIGVYPVMVIGGLVNIVCILVGANGQSLADFYIALCLLGVGWNFLYTGATTLLTETYTEAERAKTQALNEVLVFVFVGFATFTSGSVLHAFGWQAVNYGVLPLVVIVLAAVIWLVLRSRRTAYISH